MEISKIISDKRNLPRTSNLNVPCINVSCVQSASIDPCRIINLSLHGICILANNQSAFLLLMPCDRVNNSGWLYIPDHSCPYKQEYGRVMVL